MNDNTIKLLNLEHLSHRIESIETIYSPLQIRVLIQLKKEMVACPVCGTQTQAVHDYQTKSITHSISTNHHCLIIYKARRYRCRFCKKVFYEHNPFAGYYHRISDYTKLSILNHLKSYTSTFTSAARSYHTSIQSVINIFDDSVDMKRQTLPEYICMDEFFTAKVSDYKYACMLTDFKTHQVIDVYATRHKHYLKQCFSRIPKRERDTVKVFIIDMWDSYKEVIELCFPKAKIAVDSFHVIRILNEAMKKIRIETMNLFNKKTSSLESNDIYYYMLKKFHYFFVKDYEKIYNGKIKIPKLNAAWHKSDILNYLFGTSDSLKKAYKLKEAYREFNKSAEVDTCELEFDQLIKQFRNHDHPGFRAFGKTLKKWKPEIMNSFERVENRRLSNGSIEGMNSRVKTIIKSANGLRNFYRMRNRIMFSLNKNTPIKYIK